LVDGRPVKIDGNPLYPINRGTLCPAGHSGLQVLYDPDRIKSPLKRVGGRGEHKWEAISWDEALLQLQTKLTELRGKQLPHRLVFMDGDSRGLMFTVITRFMKAYGSPNYLRTDFNAHSAVRFMQGGSGEIAYDISNANYVLSFGFDFLEAEGSPMWLARMYGQLRQSEHRARARIVQVDTRYSITAAKADKWIPVNPGTEGALALGIACVIVQEELYDKEFIAENTLGFDDWEDTTGAKHIGFKTLVMREYYPEAVSRVTGVPIEDIIRIARGFGQERHAVALCGKGASSYSNGFWNQAAIQALNALAGNIGKPGGVIPQLGPPFSPLADVIHDEISKKGLSQSKFPAAGLYSNEFPAEVLLLYHSNPVFEFSDTKKVIGAVQKIPFIVSFSSFMDESTEYADLILPDHTYLEKWQDDTDVPGIGFPHVGIRKPIVGPLYDTRHTGDVLIQLAHALDGTVSKSFDHPDFLTLMKQSIKGIYESGSGSIVSEEFAESMMIYLEKRGWRVESAASFDDFWQKLVEKGGWVAAPRYLTLRRDLFQTPSGRFEFYLQSLKERIQKDDDELLLPHYVPPEFIGNENEYPLYFKVYDTNTLFGGTGANQQMLLEMVGHRFYQRWDSWVEINPETAGELGIMHNDLVWVESSRGKIKARAMLFAGAMPEVLSMPAGLGHTSYGRFAKNRGANPNDIIADKFDPVSKMPAKFSTRVKVYKA
jgi:anaerobic selenocysteine-containing dehydrogenase